MKPKVDKEVCIGCGTCPAICPAVFELGNDQKSQVKEGVDYTVFKDKIDQAKEACPVQAISVE